MFDQVGITQEQYVQLMSLLQQINLMLQVQSSTDMLSSNHISIHFDHTSNENLGTIKHRMF